MSLNHSKKTQAALAWPRAPQGGWNMDDMHGAIAGKQFDAKSTRRAPPNGRGPMIFKPNFNRNRAKHTNKIPILQLSTQ